MSEALVVVSGAAAFAATNVDDLLVLTAFFAGSSSRRHVVAGQFLGIALLTAASLVCALAALAFPAEWLGLLGVLPLAVGGRQLLSRRRDDVSPPPRSAKTAVVSVAAVTVAGGGDNLAVYVPLFATREVADWWLIVAVFAVLTGVWCAVGIWLITHRRLGPAFRRYGRLVLPWALIALGVSIIVGSGLTTAFT